MSDAYLTQTEDENVFYCSTHGNRDLRKGEVLRLPETGVMTAVYCTACLSTKLVALGMGAAILYEQEKS